MHTTRQLEAIYNKWTDVLETFDEHDSSNDMDISDDDDEDTKQDTDKATKWFMIKLLTF